MRLADEGVRRRVNHKYSVLSACPGAEWVGDAGFAMARWGDHAYRLKGNVIPAGNPVHMNPEDIMRRLEILREEHRDRSEEHTSELQSLMSLSYADCCLKKKKKEQ